jgi:hypothetical protein
MALTNTVLTASSAAIYTSTGDNVVTSVYFCNYSGAAKTIDVWAIASGGTAIDGTLIYDTVSIKANDTYVMDLERLALANGDALHASASAVTSVTATVSTQAL